MQISWEAISAISSVLGTVLIVAAAWIALGQLRESSAARGLQATLGFIEQLQSSTARNTRRFLARYRAEVEQILEAEDSIERLDVFLKDRGPADDGPTSLSELRSAASLEFIAILSLNDNVPEHLERAYLAPTIIGYWPVVEPIVRAVRLNSGESVYLQHLESLVGIVLDGGLYKRSVKRTKKRARLRLLKQAQISVSRRPALTAGRTPTTNRRH